MKNLEFFSLKYDVQPLTKSSATKRLQNGKYSISKDKNLNYKKAEKEIDLSKLNTVSFSAIMRELNKNDKKLAIEFLKIYKEHFDYFCSKDIQKPENLSLAHSLVEFSKTHKLKISKDLIKEASITELGSPERVGEYLSSIIKIILTRISPLNRAKALLNVKNKIYNLNSNELANKKMPASASIGQAITFIKTILFNQNPEFIRQVINSTVSRL